MRLPVVLFLAVARHCHRGELFTPEGNAPTDNQRSSHASAQLWGKGPHILVGASIGGAYIQGYQRAYPEDVAGLVFSNSSNRVGFLGEG